MKILNLLEIFKILKFKKKIEILKFFEYLNFNFFEIFIDFRILKFCVIFERVVSLLRHAMGCLPGNSRVVSR
jgi:hypothetical protein